MGKDRDVPEPAHAVSELIGAVSNEGHSPLPAAERNSLASERLYYETTQGAL